jgi:hypothetical protein
MDILRLYAANNGFGDLHNKAAGILDEFRLV